MTSAELHLRSSLTPEDGVPRKCYVLAFYGRTYVDAGWSMLVRISGPDRSYVDAHFDVWSHGSEVNVRGHNGVVTFYNEVWDKYLNESKLQNFSINNVCRMLCDCYEHEMSGHRDRAAEVAITEFILEKLT